MITRRNVVLGTSVLGAYSILGGGQSFGQALTTEQQRAFEGVFGADPFRVTNDDLQLFLDVQNTTPAVAEDPEGFVDYINENQIIANLRSRQGNPILYHYMLWHKFFLDMASKDHTSITEDDPTYAEQIGPCRTSRALAMAHLAMFEAVNAITKAYESYDGIQADVLAKLALSADEVDAARFSPRTAIAYAAYGLAVKLYPNKLPLAHAQMQTLLPIMGDDSDLQRSRGRRLGEAVAEVVIARRNNDGAAHEEPDVENLPPYVGSYPAHAQWRRDPVVPLPPALGGYWAAVRPFTMTSGSQFRPATAPDISSPEFQEDVAEVRILGGDPNALGPERWPTPTDRTTQEPGDPAYGYGDANQTLVGVFWGYDGTALLCAPPRLYNMIATSYIFQKQLISETTEMARYLALINIAMADAGIAAWDAKYHFRLARPVTFIREREPSSLGDDIVDEHWTPLGAPVSNGTDPNLTPPFPTYVSGHATFGAALFETMRLVFGVDAMDTDTEFDFVSDEYNGINRGPNGEIRKRVVANFKKLGDAEADNARSRVYLGIHFQIDADHGIAMGRSVAQQVVGSILKPV